MGFHYILNPPRNFAKILDQGKAGQNIGSDLYSNCLTL